MLVGLELPKVRTLVIMISIISQRCVIERIMLFLVEGPDNIFRIASSRAEHAFTEGLTFKIVVKEVQGGIYNEAHR